MRPPCGGRRKVGLLGGILGFSLLAVSPIFAADSPALDVFDSDQEDLDGDGRPDLTVVDVAFATEHDRVYIIDQQGDMSWTNAWNEAVDFANDTWLYDIHADGSIQLVVTYETDGTRVAANVYDDRTGDGQVSIERAGTDVQVDESQHWTARISSEEGWYRPDGKLNLNVRVEMDGAFPRAFDRMPANYAEATMLHDGAVDVVFEEAADEDGVALWAIKRLLTPSPEGLIFQRTGVNSNEARTPAVLPDRYFFPFLPVAMSDDDPRRGGLRYFDLPPSVHVNWEQGAIWSVGLDGYPIGEGYHVNSDQYAQPGRVNDVSFETPHAYYDLAGDGDAYPELNVRLLTRPPGDPAIWALPQYGDLPWQEVRYSWRFFNPGSLYWDFKLGMAGNYTIDDVVTLGETSFRMLAWETVPWWATEREWKMTTFVAREGDGYQSSEGLYEWEPTAGANPLTAPREELFAAREAAWAYMLGASDEAPDKYFMTTRRGFRAERRFDGPSQPGLYLSPIDGRLHLVGAEAGVFTDDQGRIVRYSDVDADGYFDRWEHVEEGELLGELQWTGTHLIYADEREIRIRKLALPNSLFETPPPRDHAEWVDQRRLLEANAPGFAANDLLAMIEQFSEQPISEQPFRATGANLRDIRADGHGYRFILEVGPEYRTFGTEEPALSELNPGSYVVTLTDSYSVRPSTPASLEVELAAVSATALRLSDVTTTVSNHGLEDARDALLQLWATSPEGETELIAERSLVVLAGSSAESTLEWDPPSAGSWLLVPKVIGPDSTLVNGKPHTVEVLPADGRLTPLTVSADLGRWPLLALGLAAAAVIAGTVAFAGLARRRAS